MKNIFENAYFGKAYRTRNGEKAIYFDKHSSEYPYLLMFSPDEALYYNCMGENEVDPSLDIVSEWQEQINE